MSSEYSVLQHPQIDVLLRRSVRSAIALNWDSNVHHSIFIYSVTPLPRILLFLSITQLRLPLLYFDHAFEGFHLPIRGVCVLRLVACILVIAAAKACRKRLAKRDRYVVWLRGLAIVLI